MNCTVWNNNTANTGEGFSMFSSHSQSSVCSVLHPRVQLWIENTKHFFSKSSPNASPLILKSDRRALGVCAKAFLVCKVGDIIGNLCKRVLGVVGVLGLLYEIVYRQGT